MRKAYEHRSPVRFFDPDRCEGRRNDRLEAPPGLRQLRTGALVPADNARLDGARPNGGWLVGAVLGGAGLDDGARPDNAGLDGGRLISGRNRGETVPRGFVQSRKRDCERRPAGVARHVHRAVMRDDDGLDDGQAESGAAGPAARAAGPRRIARAKRSNSSGTRSGGMPWPLSVTLS